MAHPSLRRQVNDAVDVRKFRCQRQHAVPVGDIELAESEILLRRQMLQPRLFQRHVIIVVEVVDADDMHRRAPAARVRRGADKAGCARHKDHRHEWPYKLQ